MKLQIRQNKLQDHIKKRIFEGFGEHSIEITGIDGVAEDPISFEIFNDQEFIGAIVVHLFWGQLHIKYLFVEKPYRGQGIARELINHACEFGKLRGCHFAFVETMNFQAPKFYQKMGFKMEFSRSGYAENTSIHFLKKNLTTDIDGSNENKVTRLGVYGVSIQDGNILLVQQKGGPYAGKLDFPGGGIEFGETPEQALRREFMEEVAMEFDSLELIDNLTATINVPATQSKEPYTFFQVGMIYKVDDCRITSDQQELQYLWVEPKTLSKNQCSALLWKYLQNYR